MPIYPTEAAFNAADADLLNSEDSITTAPPATFLLTARCRRRPPLWQHAAYLAAFGR
jgi:hypothetical protein